jgi:biotin-dependent carboxylase-like uncharacterized protein
VTIEIIEPGPLSSVQDPLGRIGWRHLGVPVGGAADPWSARLANRLVGNDDDAALLEVTLGGAVLALDAGTSVAVTGGLMATLDGVPFAAGVQWTVSRATRLGLDPGDGARGYVAVAGGLAAHSVLGSPSTDLRSGFGGLDGRALRTGDRLEVAAGRVGPPRSGRPDAAAGPIRVVAGPWPNLLPALLDGDWTVGVEADRTGVRLSGPTLEGSELPSTGLPLGAIQVPPDGRPIVMLADRPVTGGYPVPACVIRADIGRVAQLRTGHAVRFASVSVEEAILALRRAEAQLDALDVADSNDGDAGWAGAHG